MENKESRSNKQQYLIDQIIDAKYNPMEFKIYCDNIKEDGYLNIISINLTIIP